MLGLYVIGAVMMDGIANFVNICNFDLDEEKNHISRISFSIVRFSIKKVDSSDHINGNIEKILNLI